MFIIITIIIIRIIAASPHPLTFASVFLCVLQHTSSSSYCFESIKMFVRSIQLKKWL